MPAGACRSSKKHHYNTASATDAAKPLHDNTTHDKSMSAIVGAAPSLPINPDDWSYLAEGGFHIILRYDGNDPELAGRILRIGKKALGHQKEGGGEDPAKPAAAAVVVPDEAGARRKFERGVLIPLLGEQYVQPGDAVTLSREDIGKIHLRCVDRSHLIFQSGVGGGLGTISRTNNVVFCGNRGSRRFHSDTKAPAAVRW